MKKIILIGGKARHGKNQVAEFLTEELNGKCFIIAWADYLKFFAQKYYGWDGQKDKEGRHLLQYLGTDIIRNRRENFHVNIVSEVVYAFNEEFDYFIIPDTRFPNEIITPKSYFGFDKIVTCKVVRHGFESNLTGEAKSHSSETALDNWDWDYVIDSEEGLDSLRLKVKDFVRFVEEK